MQKPAPISADERAAPRRLFLAGTRERWEAHDVAGVHCHEVTS